jgi:hypothetical protein
VSLEGSSLKRVENYIRMDLWDIGKVGRCGMDASGSG